jgi:hypothetical protein
MPGGICQVEMPGIDPPAERCRGPYDGPAPGHFATRGVPILRGRDVAATTGDRDPDRLGASHGGVLRLVAGESLRLAAIGAVIGMGLAYAASRAFESLLAGVEPSDPPTYGVAAALTGVMVLSGTVAPALRAPRVDPARALRAE